VIGLANLKNQTDINFTTISTRSVAELALSIPSHFAVFFAVATFSDDFFF
jgi:hypothetical protein